ncbi:MAG: hypothetical protein ACFB4I_13365 [Cyanophyceae cyanobacterium]
MRKFHPTHQKYDPEKNSVLRYVRAGLQPFSRPLFLGSAAVLAIVAVCAGLYWQHPEWLNTTVEQPGTIDEPGIDLDTAAPAPDEFVDGSSAQIGTDVPAQPQSETLLEQLSPEEGADATQSIFPALGGTQTEGASESSPDLVERASFNNYRSFFDSNRSESSPSNLGNEGGGGGYANPEVPAVQPAPVTDNPLQRAVDRVFADQAEPAQESEAAVDNSVPEPERNVEAEARRQKVRDFNTFTDTADSAPYGTVPLNSGLNGAGSNTPTGPRSSSYRPPEDRLNSYEFNNSFSPVEQPQGRFEQGNFDNVSEPNSQQNSQQNYLGTTEIVTPQIQEPIQVEQPQFEESPLFPN